MNDIYMQVAMCYNFDDDDDEDDDIVKPETPTDKNMKI